MTVDLYDKGALPPAIAWMLLAAVIGVYVWGFVAGLARARRREQLANSAEASVGTHVPALAEGADVVLAGVVRHHEDHDVAVKVRIHQRGSESESSGSWSHAWVEVDREIILAPFLLELANGVVVLVHPPKNVDVADELDQKVWIDRNHRVLSAELVPGEKIFARGRLQRSDQAAPGSAYRDVQWGWALHPADGQMLLSSEPMGAGLRARAAFHRGYAWIALFLLAVSTLAVLPFFGRVLGSTEVAHISDTSTWETTDSDDDTTLHCAVTVNGQQREVSCRDTATTGSEVSVTHSAFGRDWELGAHATFPWLLGLLVGGVAMIYVLGYRGRRRSSRPWFRREVNESGGGKLPDPPAR